jgi:hypothetical protein
MAALRALAAASAAPARDPEMAHVPTHPNDLLLVLIDLILEHQLTVTARAALRHRHPDLLIDMIGNRPTCLGAVLRATAASRLARILLRLPPGERRRLSLTRPPFSLQLRTQPRVLCQQQLPLSPQPAAMTGPRRPNTTHRTPRADPITYRPTIHPMQDSLHATGILPSAPTRPTDSERR